MSQMDILSLFFNNASEAELKILLRKVKTFVTLKLGS